MFYSLPGILGRLAVAPVLKTVVHTTPLAVLNFTSQQGRRQKTTLERWIDRKTWDLREKDFSQGGQCVDLNQSPALRFIFAHLRRLHRDGLSARRPLHQQQRGHTASYF